LNPNPFGKYSRFTAKIAVIDPIAAITVVKRLMLTRKRLKETKLPINVKAVTRILRIKRTGLLVLSRLSAGIQVSNKAIGPLNVEMARIIKTTIASDSMVTG